MTLCRELLNPSHDSYQPMNHRCAYDYVTTEKDIGGHAEAYISRSMSWHVEGLTLSKGTHKDRQYLDIVLPTLSYRQGID